jgi:hypothetical protein
MIDDLAPQELNNPLASTPNELLAEEHDDGTVHVDGSQHIDGNGHWDEC